MNGVEWPSAEAVAYAVCERRAVVRRCAGGIPSLFEIEGLLYSILRADSRDTAARIAASLSHQADRTEAMSRPRRFNSPARTQLRSALNIGQAIRMDAASQAPPIGAARAVACACTSWIVICIARSSARACRPANCASSCPNLSISTAITPATSTFTTPATIELAIAGGAAAKALQKSLDERYAGAIRRFDAVLALWNDGRACRATSRPRTER